MTYFTKHALDKFRLLKKHGFTVSRKQIIETINKSDLSDSSRLPPLIAQKKFDEEHVLRVVYKKNGNQVKIITFYPGKIKRYEEK